MNAGKNVASIFFVGFLANSVPPPTKRTLHSMRIGQSEAEHRNEETMRTEDDEINLFKIQIKYKFAVAYCLLLLLRFRWLRFAKLISHCVLCFCWRSVPSLSLGVCNFISKIKRTRIIVRVFRELFYYEFIDVWHLSFRFACDSLSPHAFDC